MRSYAPQDLTEVSGRFHGESATLAPTGTRRMGANTHANGGALLAALAMPALQTFAVPVAAPGSVVW